MRSSELSGSILDPERHFTINELYEKIDHFFSSRQDQTPGNNFFGVILCHIKYLIFYCAKKTEQYFKNNENTIKNTGYLKYTFKSLKVFLQSLISD